MSNEMHHGHHYHQHHQLDTNEPQSTMKMYFHAGFTETILFQLWTTESIPIFICSWIFIFILGILYEGIREIRQYLDEIPTIQRATIPKAADETELERINVESTESTPQVNKPEAPPRYAHRILDTLLYTAQLLLSFSFMLIAMTFNIYLFLAIIFGIGAGHLLYTICRTIPSTSTSKNPRRT